MNKSSLDKGFDRCIVNQKFNAMNAYPNGSKDKDLPDVGKGKNVMYRGLTLMEA